MELEINNVAKTEDQNKNEHNSEIQDKEKDITLGDYFSKAADDVKKFDKEIIVVAHLDFVDGSFAEKEFKAIPEDAFLQAVHFINSKENVRPIKAGRIEFKLIED